MHAQKFFLNRDRTEMSHNLHRICITTLSRKGINIKLAAVKANVTNDKLPVTNNLQHLLIKALC